MVNLSRVSLQTTRFAVALALTLTKHIGAMISISHNFNYWKYASSALFSWPQIWKWRRLCLLNYWKRETQPVCYIDTQYLTRQNMLLHCFTFIILEECAFALQMIGIWKQLSCTAPTITFIHYSEGEVIKVFKQYLTNQTFKI